MKLRHRRDGAFVITPVDAADIYVDGETTFDVDDPVLARNLLEQDDNYGPADDDSRTVWGEISAERESRAAEAAADDPSEPPAHQTTRQKARKSAPHKIDEELASPSEEA